MESIVSGKPAPLPIWVILDRDSSRPLPPNTEETYAAKVQGVSISANQKAALIWVVKSSTGATVKPGLLQQICATDPKNPADQKPPMIGEVNTDNTLHSMPDRNEGSASATQKPEPTDFVILSVEFKLKSALG